jgi:hypothetical protein
MKKIVLKSLPPAIELLVDDRAKAEHLTREQAVVEFLHDAARHSDTRTRTAV